MKKYPRLGKSSSRFACALIVASLASLGGQAFAGDTFTWSTAPTDGSWITTTNWVNTTNTTTQTYPGNTTTSDNDVATFGVTSISSVTVATALTIGSINFSGATAPAYTLSGANLRLSVGKAITVANTVTMPQTINNTITANGTLSITNNAPAVTSILTFGGATMKTANSSTNAVVTLGGTNTGANVINNAIGPASSGSQSFSIVKSGVGTWILGGVNVYTGNTTVNAGLLAINGSTAAGSAVTVAAAGTLGGTGTVNGTVDLSGMLAPGVESVGTLNLGGILKFEAGSQLAMDLGSTGVSDSDVVNFSRLADSLQGSGVATLALAGNSINYAAAYTIFQNVSTAGFSFAGITGYDTTDYMANVTQVGNSYVLAFTPTAIATPEPASLGLMAIGTVLLASRRRRTQA